MEEVANSKQPWVLSASMFLFTRKRYIDRLKVSEIVKITPEILLTILKPIAKLTTKKGWKLLLPFDKGFVDKYSEVVQRQNLQWEIKHKQLKEAFKEGLGACPSKSRRKSRDSSISDGDATAGVDSPRRKHRRKSQSKSLSSDNESGAEGGTKRNIAAQLNKRKIKIEPKDS